MRETLDIIRQAGELPVTIDSLLTIQTPGSVAVAEAVLARAELAAAQVAHDQKLRAAVAGLTDAGWSLRDAGVVLGMSHSAVAEVSDVLEELDSMSDEEIAAAHEDFHHHYGSAGDFPSPDETDPTKIVVARILFFNHLPGVRGTDEHGIECSVYFPIVSDCTPAVNRILMAAIK